ncbi:Apolipophorin, partial [Orchesella cincta]
TPCHSYYASQFLVVSGRFTVPNVWRDGFQDIGSRHIRFYRGSGMPAPATRQTCAPVCSERRQSVLKYEEGKSYIYNFDTEVVTQLVGSTDENSRIKVKGQAALAAQSACDLVLTIQQIAITSSNGQAISRVNDIVGSSIRFAYTDGVVDSVCVSENDPTWSANIKRAIVSMLGNRALIGDTETIETDVNGKCKTIYSVDGNKYTKTKDLSSCTNRDGGMANVYGVPYTAPSQYHSIPLFNSVLTCVQELGKGIIQNVECNEGHSLDVVQSTGVRTDIKSSLTLANVQPSIVKGKETNSRSCLLYDFAEHDDSQRQKASASNAVDLLNKVCKEIESGTVSLKVPGLFLQLRKAVKYARKDDLKLIYQKITSGQVCQSAVERLGKLYLDANGMSAGDGPIAFLSEVLAAGQAEESTKDIFIAYTAFAAQPGPIALEAVEQLVSGSEAEPDYLLAASGLAHQYCRLTNPNCGSNDQYHSLVDKIAQHVRSATTHEDIEKVVVALQALGNPVTAIVNLLEDSSTNQRLKVRALDAFRRDSCQETLKKKASKIFSTLKESSQVRIQAYLTLSKCLDPEDVPVVQAIINNDDESNQVGAFVVSHVRNLIESSSPGKIALRKVFNLIKLREFPSDLRKYSRNFEISAFDPALMNSGVSVDSNVIYSQDSYIPRTFSSNLTVDAFGRSYNLVEFGIDIQNFEHVLERLLGPSGALRDITLDDIVRESADKLNKLKAGISGRFRRDVADRVSQNEIDALRSEVDIHERTDDIGNGDVYVRVLGTSILVEGFSQDGFEHQPLGARITRALEKLAEGVKDQKVDLTEPFMFMDDEIILPTSSGLPLTVQTEGTSVLSLQIQGNLDVVSLLRGNNGDMRAKIMPSSATVVKAKMVLGTGPIESGLQIEGKIHSAAGIDLKVVREDGKFELRANIPQERIQVFDIRSDIYWVEQAMDQLEKKTPLKTKVALKSIIDNQCTTSTYITKLIGLKVCADVKIPQSSSSAPLFFLNGPSVVSLFIEKVEPTMEGYYVKVESIKNQETYGLDFVLDTPGSRTNRKVQAQARAVGPSSATPQYSLKIESPLNNIEVNYKRSLTEELKGVELKVAIDGEAYTGTAEVRKTVEGAGYKLTPVIQYQLPQGNPVKLLQGEITRVPGQQLNVNLRTGGPFRSVRGSVKGSLLINQNEADNVDIEYKDLEFASEALGKVLLEGSYKRQGKVADFKLDSKYGQTAQHTLSVEAHGGSPATGENVLKLVTRSSRREFLNFDLDWHLKRGENKIEHKLDYTRGLTEPKVVIRQESEIEIKSAREFDVESELTIKHPAYNIDFHAEAEAKSVPGQERHAELELNAGNNLKAKASFESSGAGLSNYKVLGNLVLGEKTYEVSEIATKVDDHKRKYVSRISVTPGFYYEADTDVKFKYENAEFMSDLATVVKSDLFEHPVTLKATVGAKKDRYGALLKLDAQGKSFLDLQTDHKINKVAGSPGRFSGRKIAGTSKVQRNGETYDLKADLKWDAERDPTKAITVKSLTTLSISDLRIDSKNDITVVGKTSRINIRSAVSRDILNGESSAEVDYVSPSGKAYNLASKVDLENKLSTRAGRVNLKVTLPDAQPSELEVGVHASKLDQQECTFDIKADLKANYRGQKDIDIRGEASSTLPGNYRSYAGSLTAQGSVLQEPIALSLKTDVKKGRVAIKGDAKRGPEGPVRGSVDATIDYDSWSPKRTVGIKYSVTTPIDRIQSLEGELSAAYLYNSLKNFEVSHQTSLTLNGGSPYSSSVLLSVLENEAKYNYNLISEGQQVVTISAEGKLDRRHLRAKLTSEVKGAVSKLNLDVEHQLPNIEVHLTGETGLVQGLNTFEIKLANKRNADGTHDSELLARSDGEDRLRITNKLEVSPQRKSIDVLVAAGDEPTRKLFLLFNEAEAGKWNVEANARWGTGGNYLNSKGTLTKRDGSVEGELSLDSPALQANKFKVRVSKSLTDGRHGLDIEVDGNNKKQLAIGLTYGTKDESNYERSYDGTLKVEGQAVGKPLDVSGKFRLEDTTLDRQRDNGEEGRRIRANVEITTAGGEPMKLNVLAKRSNKENRLQLSLCKSGDNDCKVGDVHLKHTHSDGNLDYELRVVSEQVTGNSKETNGIVLQTRLDSTSRQFEHIAKLIINSEKQEQIGYRLYRNPTESEIGGEILLPARVIALVATSNKQSSGAYDAELAFYIDKTKNANRKISLVLSSSAPLRTTDNARSRQIELVLKHPDLSKDLKVKTRYAFAGDVTILELETVLDVFRDGDNELVSTYSVTRQSVPEGGAYNSVFSVISKGLHINVAAKGELKYAGRELSYQNVLTYENREGQVKSSQVLLGITGQRFNFEGIEFSF